jgi:hypothetical protein
MQSLPKPYFLTITLVITSVFALYAEEGNLQESTPVGSWQLRHQIVTFQGKEKQSLREIRTSSVGEAIIDGIECIWIETSIQTSEYMDGIKGSPAMDDIRIKVLLEGALLADRPEKLFENMRDARKALIVQIGDEEPKRIRASNL